MKPGKSLQPGSLALLIVNCKYNGGKVVTIEERPVFKYKHKSLFIWEAVTPQSSGAISVTDDAWVCSGDLTVLKMDHARPSGFPHKVSRTVIDSKYLIPLGDDSTLDEEEILEIKYNITKPKMDV